MFYDAWRFDDRRCARKVASQAAIETLFQYDGSSADWTSVGCVDDDGSQQGDDPHTDCTFRYEGGWATFEMRFEAVGGWEIHAVRFTVD